MKPLTRVAVMTSRAVLMLATTLCGSSRPSRYVVGRLQGQMKERAIMHTSSLPSAGALVIAAGSASTAAR